MLVIPAQAGIHVDLVLDFKMDDQQQQSKNWIPACARMTAKENGIQQQSVGCLTNLYLPQKLRKDAIATVSASMTIPACTARGMTTMHATLSACDAVEVPTLPMMQRTRAAGIAIAAATIISTIFVAMDHGGGGTNPLEILQGIAGLIVLKEVVHGVAIASVCGYAFGYSTLARRLGLHRPLVLAGLSAYLLGCVAMIGATILDGFVTPHIATEAITGSPEVVSFAYRLIYFIGTVLNDLAKLGWVLQSAGILAWSVALLHNSGFSRAVGVIGLVSSGLVIALLAVSPINLTMTALLSVLFAQLIWNLAAAVLLTRDPNRAAKSARYDRHALAS